MAGHVGHGYSPFILQGALLAAPVTGALNWKAIGDAPTVVYGLWYSGLLLALTSLSVATQQVVTLHRISSHRDGLLQVRMLLGREKRQMAGVFEPRLTQLWV